MTRALQEPSGLPGSAEKDRRPEPPGFLSAYPGYRSTALLDRLRVTDYSYLDGGGHVYLDYTGAGLPAQAQLAAHAERIRGGCFGNPHSENPTSAASTELVERARLAVLTHFSAPPGDYAAIFTPNATGACRLVGEAYPFGPRTRLVLTYDNHNSVNGIREFARSRGAVTQYVPFSSPELRVDSDAIPEALARRRPGRLGAAWRVARCGVAPWAGRGLRARRQRSLAQDGAVAADRPAAALSAAAVPRRRGLFAYPAQSNFSGVQHSLDWIETAHEHGYDVLLDAAAYVPSNRLDLSVVKPDFVAVSWYKVFGYPTGVGCLIARREALGRLWRPWFAGGSVSVASALGDWHTLAGDEARFEDGTVNFLQIPDVESGLSWVNGIGIDLIHQRVMCLTGWLIGLLLRCAMATVSRWRGSTGPPVPAIAAAPSHSTCWIPAGASSTSALWRGLQPLPGFPSVPGASATRAPARARSNSPRQTGAERCGDAPARWISTSTFSACRAAGHCAHRWAWPRTSATWSGSWHSWR